MGLGKASQWGGLGSSAGFLPVRSGLNTPPLHLYRSLIIADSLISGSLRFFSLWLWRFI